MLTKPKNRYDYALWAIIAWGLITWVACWIYPGSTGWTYSMNIWWLAVVGLSVLTKRQQKTK